MTRMVLSSRYSPAQQQIANPDGHETHNLSRKEQVIGATIRRHKYELQFNWRSRSGEKINESFPSVGLSISILS